MKTLSLSHLWIPNLHIPHLQESASLQLLCYSLSMVICVIPVPQGNVVIHCLTTAMPSEKYVVRRFCPCVNIIQCTCTNQEDCCLPRQQILMGPLLCVPPILDHNIILLAAHHCICRHRTWYYSVQLLCAGHVSVLLKDLIIVIFLLQ